MEDGGRPAAGALTGKARIRVLVQLQIQGPRVPARPGARTRNVCVLRCRRWLLQEGPSSGFVPSSAGAGPRRSAQVRLTGCCSWADIRTSLDKFTRQYDQKLMDWQNNPRCYNIAVRRHKTCFNANMLITLLEKKDEVM